nr:reticulocyte-binding protein 2 like a [Quercus suber]
MEESSIPNQNARHRTPNEESIEELAQDYGEDLDDLVLRPNRDEEEAERIRQEEIEIEEQAEKCRQAEEALQRQHHAAEIERQHRDASRAREVQEAAQRRQNEQELQKLQLDAEEVKRRREEQLRQQEMHRQEEPRVGEELRRQGEQDADEDLRHQETLRQQEQLRYQTEQGSEEEHQLKEGEESEQESKAEQDENFRRRRTVFPHNVKPGYPVLTSDGSLTDFTFATMPSISFPKTNESQRFETRTHFPENEDFRANRRQDVREAVEPEMAVSMRYQVSEQAGPIRGVRKGPEERKLYTRILEKAEQANVLDIQKVFIASNIIFSELKDREYEGHEWLWAWDLDQMGKEAFLYEMELLLSSRSNLAMVFVARDIRDSTAIEHRTAPKNVVWDTLSRKERFKLGILIDRHDRHPTI